MATYSDKLKDPRWQKKRLEILERDNWTCQSCGDKETTLHVHHKSYGVNPWDSNNDQLITYCADCHESIENDIKIFKETAHKLISQSEVNFSTINYFLQVLSRSELSCPAYQLFMAFTFSLSNQLMQDIILSTYYLQRQSKTIGREDCMREFNIEEPELPF